MNSFHPDNPEFPYIQVPALKPFPLCILWSLKQSPHLQAPAPPSDPHDDQSAHTNGYAHHSEQNTQTDTGNPSPVLLHYVRKSLFLSHDNIPEHESPVLHYLHELHLPTLDPLPAACHGVPAHHAPLHTFPASFDRQCFLLPFQNQCHTKAPGYKIPCHLQQSEYVLSYRSLPLHLLPSSEKQLH